MWSKLHLEIENSKRTQIEFQSLVGCHSHVQKLSIVPHHCELKGLQMNNIQHCLHIIMGCTTHCYGTQCTTQRGE